jgi:hypothetical protein
MIRFELKLLPLKEGISAEEARIITDSNIVAEHSYHHLKKLISNRKCRKHPSTPNKLCVFAKRGGEPEIEMIDYCCRNFVDTLK